MTIVSKVRLDLNKSNNDLNEGQIKFYLSRFISSSFLLTIGSISLQKQRQGWGVAFCNQSKCDEQQEGACCPLASCWPQMSRSSLCCLLCPGLCPLPTHSHWSPFLVSVLLLSVRVGRVCLSAGIWHSCSLFYGVIIRIFFRPLCVHRRSSLLYVHWRSSLLCVHWRSSLAYQVWPQGKKYTLCYEETSRPGRFSIIYTPQKSLV